MTLDDARPQVRRVAVGHTRESAAAVFGRHDDDLFVTSYADLEREVDLADVTALDVLVGVDGDDVLREACERAAGGQCAVRVAVRPGAAHELGAVLDRAGVGVVGVESVGDTALLSIAPHAAGQSGSAAIVLAALDAGANPGTFPTSSGSSPAPASSARRRPTPPLVHALARVETWRLGRRRRVAVIGVLVVVVIALLLLGVVPSTSRALVSVGMPLLVVLLLVMGAVATYSTLMLARQVDRQNRRLERQARRTRELVQTRTQGLAQRLARIEEAQSRLPFLEQYVEAVAEHGAATSGQLRDLLEDFEPRPPVDRSRQA